MSDPTKPDPAESAVDPAAICSPPFPAGMTRGDVMDGLQTLHRYAKLWQRSHDPSFRGWPDVEAVLSHIAVHGIPPAITLSDLPGYEGHP